MSQTTTPPNAPEVDVLAPKPRMKPEDNKFHVGNGSNGKHYWLTPPQLLAELSAKHGPFDFDPCPFPKPDDFDGLTCEWGANSYVNPPFGSIMHEGKKKGPTAWARKAIAEAAKGKRVTLVYPIDKWVLMLLAAGARVENLGDVRWLATEDGSAGKGTGRHIACFVLGSPEQDATLLTREAALVAELEAIKFRSTNRCVTLQDSRPLDERLQAYARQFGNETIFSRTVAALLLEAHSALAERDALAAALDRIANQGPNYGPDGTRETWKHWADIAREARAEAGSHG